MEEEQSWGSACVLNNYRLLTAAHLVANALSLEVAKQDDPRRYPARIRYISHDADLALLEVDDVEFFTETHPVQLDTVSLPSGELAVYGFREDDSNQAVVRGSVLGTQVGVYTHSRRSLLMLKADVPVDSGLSGGPVFSDDQFVGIAFQSEPHAGCIVPSAIIRQFLADAEDGCISGVPDLGVSVQKLENPTLRAYAHVPVGETGILVSKVFYGSSADGVICVGDVLTCIDGNRISNSGGVGICEGLEVHFSHLISIRQVGQELAVEVIRHGKPLMLSLTLRPYVGLIPLPEPSSGPSFFLFGGLVFVRLTYDYMSLWEWKVVPFRYKHLFYDACPSGTLKEVVIVSHVIPHEINRGYEKMFGMVVLRVNGVHVSRLCDVVNAFASPTGTFHVVEVDNHWPRTEPPDSKTDFGSTLVLDAAQAEQANIEIRARIGIEHNMSADLRNEQ